MSEQQIDIVKAVLNCLGLHKDNYLKHAAGPMQKHTT